MTIDRAMLPIGQGLEIALAHALADELMELTRMLTDLAADLTADPATLRRHLNSLQMVDRISQGQTAIADLLRDAQDGDHAVRRIPLDDMAKRVKGRLALHRATIDAECG